jgi:cytoskeleton protein RodZ
LGTFGQTLRQAREDLGASLADAERETRISRRHLEALEAENEAALPAAVYTRGFIKIYCQYLGLNPEGMVDLFGPQQALVDNVQIRPIPAEINQPRSVPVRPAVVVAALVLVSFLAVYLWGQYTSFQENVGRIDAAPTTRATTTPAVVVSSPQPSPVSGPPILGSSPVAGPSPSPRIAGAAPERGLIVDVRVAERTWMEVWVDGRSVLGETVQNGFSRSFTAEQQVRIRVGNAAGVQVVVNGAIQGPLGARGQAVDAIWGRQ